MSLFPLKTLVFVLPVYLVLQRTAAAKARPAKAVTVKATPAFEAAVYFQNPLSCPPSPPPPPPPPIRKIPVSLLIVLQISSTTGEGPPAEAVEVVKKKSKSMDDGCKE